MKQIILCFLLFNSLLIYSQDYKATDTIIQITPESIVKNMFVGFHKKDTTAVARYFVKDFFVNSVEVKNDESTIYQTSKSTFLKNLKSIPDNLLFEERLLSLETQQYGAIATVFVGYEFYINNVLSHSGTNVFTLMKHGNSWLISALDYSHY